ncbi:complement factor H-related protein 1-like isoform X2 [Centropristis striata]|uniref:complement factor H-related protein 1-like isoform X2 n=1 Tax=Centropristis striata TaxID=184440 RepID=UPI0027E0D45B|nr:complement factor H-related protein 1-like isoform X2 [Centropristis striata]
MCAKYLGFVLLVWFPGVLHAQSAPQSCSAPILNGGYLVPEQEEYSHETMLSYGCEKGLKPAAEGWWSTSTCQDGTWSPRPECIDKEACLPPHIPNAEDRENESGWYANGRTISIKCNEGYGAGSQEATCEKGVWSSVLVCEKSFTSCDAPPKIPHAVIITQGYQEVFAANSKLEYECEDGFTVEVSQRIITCINGNWTTLPTCSAAEVEKAVEPATSDDRNPARGGSSANSGMNDRDGSLNAPITTCGDVPVVPDAVVIEEKRTFVRYRCSVFYTQVGPELVYCNSNGRWTQLPTCQVRERFCEVDPARYQGIALAISEVVRITEGQQMDIPCYWSGTFSRFECHNEQIRYTQCYRQ